MSNFACTSCESCDGCTGSHNCTGCRDCAGSTACRDCVSSNGSSNCTNSRELTQCTDCHNCESCMGCNGCRDCTGCTGCTNCTNCQNQIGKHGWVNNQPPQDGDGAQGAAAVPAQPFAWQEMMFPGAPAAASASQPAEEPVEHTDVDTEEGPVRVIRQGSNTWVLQFGQEIFIGDVSMADAVEHIEAGHELLQGPNGAFFDSGDGMVDIHMLEGGSRGNKTGESMGLEFPTYKISREELEKCSNCVVCQCEYEVGDTVKMLPCLHKFHPGCIVEWLVRKRECPVCKWSVDSQGPEEPAEAAEGPQQIVEKAADTLPEEPASIDAEQNEQEAT